MVFAILTDIAKMQEQVPAFTIISIVLVMITWSVIAIWNIIKGVKVLVSE
jgi:hypothetical protein